MKHQFKPFDQVLVRDDNSVNWNATLFSRSIMRNGIERFVSIALRSYEQCIPYNEQTAYLNGKCLPYQESEPKVWHVTNIKNGEAYEFTRNEFEHFIKTAVLNNKDITDFNARYVNN